MANTLLVNTIFDFFWTTARKRMELINSQHALALAKQTKVLLNASVSRMLHAREYCGRVIRSLPDWPRVRSQERHTVSSCYITFKTPPSREIFL